MKELVQSILVYIVIVSVLRGLITNPKYSQYFQFFSGIIMILLMLTPILSVLDYENQWYEILEEKLLQMDLTEIEEQMQVTEDKFADIVEEEYQQTAVEQIKKLAEQKGVSVDDAKVILKRGGDAWEIEEITVTTKEEVESGEDFSVEAIQIGEGQRVQKEDESKPAKSLRKQICSYFVIGEDKVHIWK